MTGDKDDKDRDDKHEPGSEAKQQPALTPEDNPDPRAPRDPAHDRPPPPPPGVAPQFVDESAQRSYSAADRGLADPLPVAPADQSQFPASHASDDPNDPARQNERDRESKDHDRGDSHVSDRHDHDRDQAAHKAEDEKHGHERREQERKDQERRDAEARDRGSKGKL